MGLYDQINNSKKYKYDKLDIRTFNKIISTKSCKETISHTLILSRMSYIQLCISLPNSRTNKDIINRINKLFKWLYYYQRIQQLYDLKAHHIEIGYSKMTTIELNCKISKLYSLRTNIENKIEELYYGTKNNLL